MKEQLSPIEAMKRNTKILTWTFSSIVFIFVSAVVFFISSK